MRPGLRLFLGALALWFTLASASRVRFLHASYEDFHANPADVSFVLSANGTVRFTM